MPPGGGLPPSGGWGPPPGGGSGWGPPGAPPGGPPFGPAPAAPPKRTGLYVALGCGCVVLLACVVGAASFGSILELLGPGEEVASTSVTIGQPFALDYVQDGAQRYEAWLEVDVDYSAGYNLNGTMLLSENGTAFGQYTLAETGTGSAVQERSSSRRVSWSSTNLGGNGHATGDASLFPIPARESGHRVTLSGTIYASPGTSGRVRLFVAKRD